MLVVAAVQLHTVERQGRAVPAVEEPVALEVAITKVAQEQLIPVAVEVDRHTIPAGQMAVTAVREL